VTLQLLKQFAPGVSAFPVTVNDSQQLFGAIFERSHQNHDTTAFFIEPNVEVNDSMVIKSASICLTAVIPISLTKMSTEPQKEESDGKRAEDLEVKTVPEGNFGGTIEKPIIVKEGESIPEDTGDQGGGQN
jgi:hypothetical protein